MTAQLDITPQEKRKLLTGLKGRRSGLELVLLALTTYRKEATKMKLTEVIKQLEDERVVLEQALVGLRRLEGARAGSGRRRGRPPAWLKDAESKTAKQDKKK